MPNILFVSNNQAHFPLSTVSTTAGKFDSSRVPYAIILEYLEVITSSTFTPTSGDISWVHFRLFIESSETTENPNLCQGFDVNNNLLFSIDKEDNSPAANCVITLYKNTGTVVVTATIPFNKLSKMNACDIRYEATGALTNLKLYVNGGLAAEANAAETVAFGQVAYFSVSNAFSTQVDPTGNMWLSEFIVADGDTRNARLDLLRPVASGGETDWVGDVTDLGDDDPTTGMTSIAANQRQTMSLSAYTGAANISAVVIITQSVAGANGPQNLRHTVRMSTVNYDGPADFPIGDTLQFNVTDFQINPATSLPWTSGDLAALEMGFVSKV